MNDSEFTPPSMLVEIKFEERQKILFFESLQLKLNRPRGRGESSLRSDSIVNVLSLFILYG
ncbi:MAG: hypothetical protein COU70_01970 [Parcubacteria group bacterium CG10_big_fil_rev_8_21_14_0_10_35_15]|nr:MAG: hypothetical protein COU70_01970 [Parcubacteria group bacterium CG10_big_fil_rev_8_21_14_0_10_35_15]